MSEPASLHIPRTDRLPHGVAYVVTGVLIVLFWSALYVAYRLVRAMLG